MTSSSSAGSGSGSGSGSGLGQPRSPSSAPARASGTETGSGGSDGAACQSHSASHSASAGGNERLGLREQCLEHAARRCHLRARVIEVDDGAGRHRTDTNLRRYGLCFHLDAALAEEAADAADDAFALAHDDRVVAELLADLRQQRLERLAEVRSRVSCSQRHRALRSRPSRPARSRCTRSRRAAGMPARRAGECGGGRGSSTARPGGARRR